ncbi:sialidase-like isoform X2 [Chroicocephalus ridibundus]
MTGKYVKDGSPTAERDPNSLGWASGSPPEQRCPLHHIRPAVCAQHSPTVAEGEHHCHRSPSVSIVIIAPESPTQPQRLHRHRSPSVSIATAAPASLSLPQHLHRHHSPNISITTTATASPSQPQRLRRHHSPNISITTTAPASPSQPQRLHHSPFPTTPTAGGFAAGSLG